ncbi:MAG: FAD-binding protein [Thermodesulfobacteriota bacterium]|nr:FAD-binding protein [Thermodesulfobacteriota bacterium]
MDQEAIKAFEEVIGREYTLTDHSKLQKYHYSTIPIERVIDAVLLPNSVEDVQQIVNIAKRFNIHIYPISTGNNWGYGSAKPVRDNNVIIDLSRMNRIVKVDTELAYVVIEPGVTQQQLYEHLSENSTGLMMDPTGSGPSCSVLGNTLERGYGITPYGDHFESVCGMEVVLANGEILRTGFGHYENARATHLFKYGAGPYLDGIFTQSNFGVVTKIGVWLMPEPEHFEACYFFCNNENALGPLIDAARWLLLNRVVKGSINLVHRNRSLTMLSQYPWKEMNGNIPLDERVWKALADKKNIGVWNGVSALYGTKEEVKAAKKAIKRKLRGIVTKMNFLSDWMLGFAERFQKPVSFLMRLNLKELLKVLEPSYKLLKGKPGEVSLPSPYWRMKKDPPAHDINPARDNCGLFWCAPVVPMKKENAVEFMNIIEPIFKRHGFEACITFTTVTHRAFDCTLPILYNKDDPDETRRASECYKNVLSECMKKGYIPYRFGIQSMAELVEKKDTYWDVIAKLKKALDPQGIISPGRYSQ